LKAVEILGFSETDLSCLDGPSANDKASEIEQLEQQLRSQEQQQSRKN
jgi:hypothetical protein